MRSLLAISVAATLSLFAVNAQARSAKDDGSERVVKIETHDAAGPVHRSVTLALDKAAVVELDADARDVLVSDPQILDAVVRAPRRIFLLAQKIGEANAFFFDAEGRQIAAIDVRVEKDVGDLASVIRQEIPDANVRVESLNGSVVLSGTVDSQSDASRAADIATRFATDPDKAIDPTKLVNMLRVKGSEQVMLKVKVAEVQRQIAKQLGLNFAAGGMLDGIPMALASDNQFALLGQALADLSGASVGQVCSQGTLPFNDGPCTFKNPAQETLQALEQVGLIHTLAEPNLTAVSGETAKFLAGGEFPVPTSRDLYGNITITFKQFGVGLAFTPVVISPGRISLQVSSEVSELTNTGAFTEQATTSTSNGVTTVAPGITIPALDVRRAETTIELPSGGSFAIAGLMQHTTKQTIDAFPGLKELPVLGSLFRSRDFENNETELVIMVSAYLVAPGPEGKFALPTDGFKTPSDFSTILNGRINDSQPKPEATPAAALSQGATGYIVR